MQRFWGNFTDTMSSLWILFSVVGTTFSGRDKNIKKHVFDGDRILLVREPDNPYDKYAVVVMHKKLKSGKTTEIGYVPRELSGLISCGIQDELVRCDLPGTWAKKALVLYTDRKEQVMVLTSLKPNPLEFLGVRSIYG